MTDHGVMLPLRHDAIKLLPSAFDYGDLKCLLH